MFDFCAPTLIYIAFSLTQVIIDTFNGFYNTALVKLVIMVMISILLNVLCEKGLGVASWIIVFIPFIMMTFITSVLLYVFGLNASTGKADIKKPKNNIVNFNKNVYTKENGDVVIYYPNYDAKNNAAFYKSPNFIVPAPRYKTKSTPSQTPSSSEKNKVVDSKMQSSEQSKTTQTTSSTTAAPKKY